jgi:hypothetical protein
MHHIVVFSKDSQAAFLWFRTREKAEIELKNIHDMLKGKTDVCIVTAKDDFGAVLMVPTVNISHCVFNDISKQTELQKTLEEFGYAKSNRS